MGLIRSAFLWGMIAASVQIRGVDGVVLRPLEPAGVANVIIFIATDCPIANGYAPEIQHICGAYHSRGVTCMLLYVDPRVGADAVRKHLAEYRYSSMPAAVDGDHGIAIRVGATVTPEAAVVDRGGTVRYRGRIDNQYVALGRARRVVTVHDLRDALDAVLAGKPVAASDTASIGCFIVSSPRRRK